MLANQEVAIQNLFYPSTALTAGDGNGLLVTPPNAWRCCWVYVSGAGGDLRVGYDQAGVEANGYRELPTGNLYPIWNGDGRGWGAVYFHCETTGCTFSAAFECYAGVPLPTTPSANMSAQSAGIPGAR